MFSSCNSAIPHHCSTFRKSTLIYAIQFIKFWLSIIVVWHTHVTLPLWNVVPFLRKENSQAHPAIITFHNDCMNSYLWPWPYVDIYVLPSSFIVDMFSQVLRRFVTCIKVGNKAKLGWSHVYVGNCVMLTESCWLQLYHCLSHLITLLVYWYTLMLNFLM